MNRSECAPEREQPPEQSWRRRASGDVAERSQAKLATC